MIVWFAHAKVGHRQATFFIVNIVYLSYVTITSYLGENNPLQGLVRFYSNNLLVIL